MAKASLTLVFFLFATLFGFVSARPLVRRTVAQLKEDLENVSHSIDLFADQVSILGVVSPGAVLVVLDAISLGFGQCVNDLIGVDSLPDSDSQDILEQMQSFSPTFVSSMNRMAAANKTAHGPAAPARQSSVGNAVGDVANTLNGLTSSVKNIVDDLTAKSQNKQQKAAYQQVGNQMVDAIQNASPSHSHK